MRRLAPAYRFVSNPLASAGESGRVEGTFAGAEVCSVRMPANQRALHVSSLGGILAVTLAASPRSVKLFSNDLVKRVSVFVQQELYMFVCIYMETPDSCMYSILSFYT